MVRGFPIKETRKKDSSAIPDSVETGMALAGCILDADFSTKKAPDLKIFLSPLSVNDANEENSTKGSLMIAPLTSNKGAQSYEIPESVVLTNYASVLIHCEAYAKLWSAASL